jgi:hypothetical protein
MVDARGLNPLGPIRPVWVRLPPRAQVFRQWLGCLVKYEGVSVEVCIDPAREIEEEEWR